MRAPMPLLHHGLKPELSRAAKRRRLERIVRRHYVALDQLGGIPMPK